MKTRLFAGLLGLFSVLLLTLACAHQATALTVVDANGTEVGEVVGVAHDVSLVTTAAIRYQGRWLLVQVLRDRFQHSPLLFESLDCTGQAYQDPKTSPFKSTAVNRPGSTLYYEAGPLQPISARSVRQYDGPCVSETRTEQPLVPMHPSIRLDKMFTRPFTVTPPPWWQFWRSK